MALVLLDSTDVAAALLQLTRIADTAAAELVVQQQRLSVERDILYTLRYGAPAVSLVITATIEGQPSLKGKGHLMVTLKDNQKVPLSISAVDAKGNAAPVQDGSVVFTSSDPALLTVGPDPDDAGNQLKAVATAVGPLGAAQVTVTADADLGDGVTTLTGLVDVEIVAGQAVSLAVAAGVPVDQ